MIKVLIDLSWLGYRAMYSTGNLGFEDTKTGVIFGVFDTIRQLASDPRVNSTDFAFFADSRHSYRKQEFSWYKEKRHSEKRSEQEQEDWQAMHDQIELLRYKIFPSIGIPVYSQNGLESDDLIAMAASTFTGKEKQAVIITSDGDLYQCITDAVHWYDPSRNKYFDPLSFFGSKGIQSELWAEVKAYSGCSTDEVPGIPGIGETTAIMHIRYGLKPWHVRAIAIASPEGQEIYKRNLTLVKLPHAKTKPITLVKPEYKEDVWRDWMKQFGIESFFKGKKGEDFGMFFNTASDAMKQQARAPSGGIFK